jgi:hypothetical protein
MADRSRRMRAVVTCGVMPAVLSLGITPARAQTPPLSQLLPELILRDITLDSPPLPAGVPGSPEGFTHVAHFSPLEAHELNNPVVGIVQSFNTQMATQFSTFPLGSSTGGLTYVFDENVGTFRRASSSFGPLFGERALTIGKRKLSAGFNYQRTSYNTFEGQDLDNGSIKFYLRHEDCCNVVLTPEAPGFALTQQPNGTRLNPPLEGDLIEASLSMEATTNTTALFVNYGITNRWDVGVAVPIVRVHLDASVNARIIRFATAGAPNVHTFQIGNPDATRTVRSEGHATGLGDVVLRTKYRFLTTAGGGLAAGVDLRLPTGDEEQLLGTGGVHAKFLLIASSERGRLGEHVNIGYTAAQGDVPGTVPGLAAVPVPNEFNYSGGVEIVAGPKITVMGDVLGRTLRGTDRLELTSKSFEYVQFPPPTGPGCNIFPGTTCATFTAEEFSPRPGNLSLVLGTGGIKYNPVGNLLISGSVLFPLTDAGLRSHLTTIVGLDYAF